jgi:hypothetical protein
MYENYLWSLSVKDSAPYLMERVERDNLKRKKNAEAVTLVELISDAMVGALSDEPSEVATPVPAGADIDSMNKSLISSLAGISPSYQPVIIANQADTERLNTGRMQVMVILLLAHS